MLAYEIWLSMKLNFQVRKIQGLIERFGDAARVFDAKQDMLREVPYLTKLEIKSLSDKSIAYAKSVLRFCEKNGYRIMTINDDDYPERLYNIPDPPRLLYIAGELPPMDGVLALALVGTREPTEYGLSVSERFARELSGEGAVIVSGMARGIDGAAHRGALKAGGKTVAVLGNGLDRAYPSEHEELMLSIMKHGAVVTEYPPGSEPKGEHFPRRNRIISGLSHGVIVVEAPRRSGSLITMDIALEQGRDVFAVPGNVDDPKSIGSNLAIVEGAKIVTQPFDVLQEYIGLFPYIKLQPKGSVRTKKPEVSEKRRKSKPSGEAGEKAEELPKKMVAIPENISDNEKVVLEALLGGPRHIDEIAQETGLPPGTLSSVLTMLELSGYIETLPGKQFRVI